MITVLWFSFQKREKKMEKEREKGWRRKREKKKKLCWCTWIGIVFSLLFLRFIWPSKSWFGFFGTESERERETKSWGRKREKKERARGKERERVQFPFQLNGFRQLDWFPHISLHSMIFLFWIKRQWDRKEKKEERKRRSLRKKKKEELREREEGNKDSFPRRSFICFHIKG